MVLKDQLKQTSSLANDALGKRFFFKKHTIFLHLEDNKLRENGLFLGYFSLVSCKKRETTAEKHDYKI